MEDMKKKRFQIVVFITIIIAAFFTVMILKGSAVAIDERECGEKICSEFNQEYRGWSRGNLQCSFNYEKYGYPWVYEIFTFVIDEEARIKFCEEGIKPGEIIEQNITLVNETE